MAITNPLLKFTQPKSAVPATSWGGAATSRPMMIAGTGLGGSPRESGAVPMLATSPAAQKTNPAIYNAATAAAKAGQPTFTIPVGQQGQGTKQATPGVPQTPAAGWGAIVNPPAQTPHPATPAQPTAPAPQQQTTAPAGPSWGSGPNPNWGSWQTGVPLYGQFTGPNGKDWGVQPRLNMAYAQLTGYTGGFGNAANNTWATFYNGLSPDMKAKVNALKNSYPANTNPGAVPPAGHPTTTPTPTTPTPTTPTPTTPTPTTPNPTGGVQAGWEKTGAPPAAGGTPAGVSYVMPTFDQGSSQFTGYSPASAQWGNQANMSSYYPTGR